jgi:DNA-binding NarL/FixJ family response regulator
LGDSEIRYVGLEARWTVPKACMALLGPPDDFARCERWIRNGVKCYLQSSSSDGRVVRALNLADECDMLVVDACFQRGLLEATSRLQPAEALSRRELEILRLVRDGLHTREIATGLGVTGHTVEFHMRNLVAKLGVRSRGQAVGRGILLGLIASVDVERVPEPIISGDPLKSG